MKCLDRENRIRRQRRECKSLSEGEKMKSRGLCEKVSDEVDEDADIDHVCIIYDRYSTTIFNKVLTLLCEYNDNDKFIDCFLTQIIILK